MSVVCPRGHASPGDRLLRSVRRLDPGVARRRTGGPRRDTAVLPVVEEVDTSPAARREPCPACGAARSGDDRYCESCGHDFLGPPPAPAGWEAIVTADRAQFDRLAVDGRVVSGRLPERRFVLADGESRIGRSRGHPDEHVPEIDLAGAPGDPGVSRLHAMLERRADGGDRRPRPRLDERNDGQRRPGADRPADSDPAGRRRSRPRRRVDHDHRPQALVVSAAWRGDARSRAGTSRPTPSTIATSCWRFSFWGRSPSSNRRTGAACGP